jgi:hypothetical protein
MLELVVIDEYLNIFDLINFSKTNKYNNNLVKNNFKRLMTNYYNNNIKDKKGKIVERKYSKNNKCEICGYINKKNLTGYIDPFLNKTTCFRCKTLTVTKTEVYNKYKVFEEDLCQINYLFFESGPYGYMTLYPMLEVLVLFYLKHNILNPMIIKRTRKKIDRNGHTLSDIRYYKFIDILFELKLSNYVEELKEYDICEEYIKSGRHGVRKVKKYLEEYFKHRLNKINSHSNIII